MKILYFNYIETNAGWGAECFVDSALRKLGHEVVSIDFKMHQDDLEKRILDAGDFDVVLLERGDWFPKEVLRAINRPIVFWASELVMRCRDQDRLLYSGLFTHIFVHSATCEQIVSKRNSRRGFDTVVKCLLNGYDSDFHKRLDGIDKSIDVLFIGNVTERRKRILEELKKRGIDITVCKGVFGEDFVRAVNSAKIVINIHSSTRLDTETRIFEVLGCGGFLISEPLSQENPFIPGEHYVESDISEFPELVQYYLRNDNERCRIAESGHAEALEKHTYFERTKREIVPVLQEAVENYNYRVKKSNCFCDSAVAVDSQRLERYATKRKNRFRKMVVSFYLKCFGRYQLLWDRIVDLLKK